MTKVFRQRALSPGQYRLQDGSVVELTSSALRAFATGTRSLLKHGHRVPVLLEHARPASEEGAPIDRRQLREIKADRLRNAVGWLADVWVQGGDLYQAIEVGDPAASEKIERGLIPFTSPELRKEWLDAKGERFPSVISHVALTLKPRDITQEQLTPGEVESVESDRFAALQFSLEDWIEPMPKIAKRVAKKPVGKPTGKPKPEFLTALSSLVAQFADTTDESEQTETEDSADGEGDSQQIAGDEIQDIIELLATAGIPLPDDTDASNLIERIRVALTAQYRLPTEQAETTDAVTEEAPMLQQYSVSDAEAGKGGKVLGRLVKRVAGELDGRIAALEKSGQISKPVAERLRKHRGAVQFSAEGDELPQFSASQVVAMLAENGRLTKAAAQFSTNEDEVEVDPPAGYFDTSTDQGPARGTPQHKELVSRLASRANPRR